MRLKYFISEPYPCSYLADRFERKYFTRISGHDPDGLIDLLAQHGFRRSRDILYTHACPTCCACVPVRIRVRDFSLSKSQIRTARRNSRLKRLIHPSEPTEIQYQLFRRYLKSRHKTGGMEGMTWKDYVEMVDGSVTRSSLIEYWLPAENSPAGKELVAVAHVDYLDNGLSMLYSFFDPDRSKLSLGTFMILDTVNLAKEMQLDYVYLGFWVPGSQKMSYKANFSALESLKFGKWSDIGDRASYDLMRNHPNGIGAQVRWNQKVSERKPALSHA